VLAAVFRPGLEKNGSVGGYKGLELALGGTNDCYDLGEATGVLGWPGKGARETNFAGAASLSALSGKKKNEATV